MLPVADIVPEEVILPNDVTFILLNEPVTPVIFPLALILPDDVICPNNTLLEVTANDAVLADNR